MWPNKKEIQPGLRPEMAPPIERGGQPLIEIVKTPEQIKNEVGQTVESKPLEKIDAANKAVTLAAADLGYQKYQELENVLSEDLSAMYSAMVPKDQERFKLKGEETAKKIFQLVYQQTKVNVKKIIKLIKDWLKLIPGINKYFLEQEAKIKADKIAELAVKNGNKVDF